MVDLIESQLYSSHQMFTHKTYDKQKSSFAYLVVPTASFVKYIGNFKDILKTRTIKKPEPHSGYKSLEPILLMFFKTSMFLLLTNYTFFIFAIFQQPIDKKMLSGLVMIYDINFFHNGSVGAQIQAKCYIQRRTKTILHSCYSILGSKLNSNMISLHKINTLGRYQQSNSISHSFHPFAVDYLVFFHRN